VTDKKGASVNFRLYGPPPMVFCLVNFVPAIISMSWKIEMNDPDIRLSVGDSMTWKGISYTVMGFMQSRNLKDCMVRILPITLMVV
jgi:hypothetical protein